MHFRWFIIKELNNPRNSFLFHSRPPLEGKICLEGRINVERALGTNRLLHLIARLNAVDVLIDQNRLILEQQRQLTTRLRDMGHVLADLRQINQKRKYRSFLKALPEPPAPHSIEYMVTGPVG